MREIFLLNFILLFFNSSLLICRDKFSKSFLSFPSVDDDDSEREWAKKKKLKIPKTKRSKSEKEMNLNWLAFFRLSHVSAKYRIGQFDKMYAFGGHFYLNAERLPFWQNQMCVLYTIVCARVLPSIRSFGHSPRSFSLLLSLSLHARTFCSSLHFSFFIWCEPHDNQVWIFTMTKFSLPLANRKRERKKMSEWI